VRRAGSSAGSRANLRSVLSDGELAEIGSAGFTALTALAAFASVARVERDRWKSQIPDLHIEVLADIPNDEMRVTIFNLGGAAWDVQTLGVIGPYGWVYLTPPTSFWRAGESRTYTLSMPTLGDQDVYTFVEGRDVRKKHVVITTHGGAVYRWPLRKVRRLSAAKMWQRLFPGIPAPYEATHPQPALELVERHL
jgi:hypothetical protein